MRRWQVAAVGGRGSSRLITQPITRWLAGSHEWIEPGGERWQSDWQIGWITEAEDEADALADALAVAGATVRLASSRGSLSELGTN